ncbi:hypothetical protein QYF36_006490 [Acer negundo]|nr:hypothetical protein QYF36_006490 [Acer negundo]
MAKLHWAGKTVQSTVYTQVFLRRYYSKVKTTCVYCVLCTPQKPSFSSFLVMAPTAAMLSLFHSHNNRPSSSSSSSSAAAAAAASFLEFKFYAVKWLPPGCLALFKAKSDDKPSSGVDSSSASALEKKV